MESEKDLIHLISLGAGVQSSTMALMAARGDILPMPTAAIFADTGWEPAGVYEWLEKLRRELPFPVHVVRHHGLPLREHTLLSGGMRDKKMHMPLPLFTSPNGMTRRQCTRDWKIRPIERKVKELMGHKKFTRLPTKPQVCQWIGISVDEVARAKPSRDAWKIHRHPLLELRMRRQDCLDWMEENGYPAPPRSACIGCPYHDDREWWKIRQNPNEWADAIEVDSKIRRAEGMTGEAFLHKKRVPLSEAVPLTEPPARETNREFAAECEGMCGV